MVDSRNIADVLEAGYFPTSRAKRADDSGASSSDDDSTRRYKLRGPERDPYVYDHDASASVSTTDSAHPHPRTGFSSNSSSTLSMPEYPAPEAARRKTHKELATPFVRIRGYPPSPSVEDELESLAREQHAAAHAAEDDAVPNKGDLDQFPILMDAKDYQPERRFVLVTPEDDDDDDDNDDAAAAESAKPAPKKPSLDTREPDGKAARNKYDPSPTATAAAAAATSAAAAAAAVASSGSVGSRPPPSSSTMLNERGEPIKRTRVRSQSSAHVDQQSRLDPTAKRVPPAVDTSYDKLAPGRDKSYHDYGRPPNSASPTALRTPTTGDSQHRPRSSYGGSSREDMGSMLSPQTPGGADHRRSRSTAEPSRIDRVDEMASSAYSDSGRPPSRTNSLYMRSGRSRETRRTSPPREEEPSGDDINKTLRTAPTMLLRKPTTDIREGEAEFVTADNDDVVPPMPTTRSRGRTPTLPTGRAPFGDDPRHSMPILPVSEQDRPRREDLPYPDDDSPRGGRSPVAAVPTRTRSRSRAPTMRVSTASIPVPPAVVAAPPSPGATDRRSMQFTSSGDPRSPTMGASFEGSLNAGQSQYWQPAAFDPDQNRLSVERPPGAYRRYSEDMSQTRLPECRRKKPIAGKKDWMTLEQCTNFNICPTCYGGLFSQSAFSDDFVPAARPLDLAIACDFGSVPWYRIAWLLILKNRRADLLPFHWITNTVKSAILNGETCPGDRAATRSWYSIAYPKDGQLIPNFDICYACASSIELLLPQLKKVFVPVAPASEPTRSMCAMRFADDRKRFVQYFDVMETVADRAAAAASNTNVVHTRGTVLTETDLTQLATSLDRLSSFVECREDTPIIDGGWHEMCDMPDVTVCGDCFDEVVLPHLEADNAVARKFYIKARRRAAPTTCQLYSDRMRDVFRKACRKGDASYLGTRVSERCEVEGSIRAKLDRLRREADVERQRGRDRDAKRLEEKIELLIKEWRKWE